MKESTKRKIKEILKEKDKETKKPRMVRSLLSGYMYRTKLERLRADGISLSNRDGGQSRYGAYRTNYQRPMMKVKYPSDAIEKFKKKHPKRYARYRRIFQKYTKYLAIGRMMRNGNPNPAFSSPLNAAMLSHTLRNCRNGEEVVRRVQCRRKSSVESGVIYMDRI